MTTTTAVPGLPLEVTSLTKDFGAVRAVDDLTFTVAPGRVTGFLGPNGAGKTTTLRCLLGLVSPTNGHTTIGGRSYRDLPSPMRAVGAALEATGFHPGRTAADHLRVLAVAGGVDPARAAEVLHQVGLEDSAERRIGGFSLGMRQRLQLAATMLGDPRVLILDEPANGLDPEGIAWLRGFLQHLAAQGRTVLVSSHVLSEVEQTVEDVVIIARGRLVRACPLAELRGDGGPAVVVRTPAPEALRAALTTGSATVTVTDDPDGSLRVEGATAQYVGSTAFTAGVELHELRPVTTELEEVFLSLTRGDPELAAPTEGVPA